MADWVPGPAHDRVRLAEGEVGGWPWVFEAWRRPDTEGGGVWSTLRSPGAGFGCHPVELNGRVSEGRFEGPDEGSVGVLCGAVSPEVDAVLVTPPDRSPLSAAIVDGAALGRFFFLEFAWPVEHVGIAVEPSRLAQPFPFLVNTRAEDRRMEEEAIVAGQGESPVGTRWRLRVWQAAPGDRRLSFEEQRRDGHWDGGGCGGPGRGSDQLVRLSMAGGNPRREQHLVGEVDSSIAAVRLVLEEGHEIAAQVLRGEDLPDDYWVAFVGPEARVTDLVALDEHGEIVARDAHAIEALQRHREFSEREWRPS